MQFKTIKDDLSMPKSLSAPEFSLNPIAAAQRKRIFKNTI